MIRGQMVSAPRPCDPAMNATSAFVVDAGENQIFPEQDVDPEHGVECVRQKRIGF